MSKSGANALAVIILLVGIGFSIYLFVPETVYLEYSDEKFLNHIRIAIGAITLVLSLGMFGIVKSLGKEEKED